MGVSFGRDISILVLDIKPGMIFVRNIWRGVLICRIRGYSETTSMTVIITLKVATKNVGFQF